MKRNFCSDVREFLSNKKLRKLIYRIWLKKARVRYLRAKLMLHNIKKWLLASLELFFWGYTWKEIKRLIREHDRILRKLS